MIERRIPSTWTALMVVLLTTTGTFAADTPEFNVGEREIVATKAQRDDLGLKWFHDGNLGMVQSGTEVRLYGANGQSPVRVTGTREHPLQKVERVTIKTADKGLQYLAGGPIYRDPQSGSVFLFYHAEIHRGTYKNFYSFLGSPYRRTGMDLCSRTSARFSWRTFQMRTRKRAWKCAGLPT